MSALVSYNPGTVCSRLSAIAHALFPSQTPESVLSLASPREFSPMVEIGFLDYSF